MRFRNVIFEVLVIIGVALFFVAIALAQAPARGATQTPARGATSAPAPAPAPARGRGTAPARQQVRGNLLQVMQGILFPNSNVIFAAQTQDPAAIKRDADPTSSPNPLTGLYGGWEAIENSGIALAEAANLLTLPGRTCANGKPVPLQNADWAMFVQGLRDAGMATYKAAQSKNMDAIIDVSDTVATACMTCHDVYREKTPAQGGLAARCTK